MIKENTEPKDEQIVSTPNMISSSNITMVTSPASTISQTVQQQRAGSNYKWKQISLQGLDSSPQQTHITSPSKMSTPPLNSITQRVNRFESFLSIVSMIGHTFLLFVFYSRYVVLQRFFNLRQFRHRLCQLVMIHVDQWLSMI